MSNSINRARKVVPTGFIVKVKVQKADLYFRLEIIGQTGLRGGSTAGQDAHLGNIATSTSSGWKKIQDSDADDLLVPLDEKIFYQIFYGVSPSRMKVYRQFVSGRDRGTLNKSLTVGDNVGYVDGFISPYNDPSSTTEFWMLQGYDLAFNGSNPTSITKDIKLNFLVNKYRAYDATEEVRRQPTLKNLARVITLGEDDLVAAVSWMKDQIRNSKDIQDSDVR